MLPNNLVEVRKNHKFNLSSLNKWVDNHLENFENIIDVNEKTVHSVIEKNFPVEILIHGHTHRQNTHRYKAFTRFVLGDWKENQGNYLIWNKAKGFEFKTFS